MEVTRPGSCTFLLLIALAFTAVPAANATVIFDFTRNATNNPLGLATGDLGNSISVIESGLGVDIVAFDSLAPGNAGVLNRTVNGLGVTGRPGSNQIGTSNNGSEHESVLFDFSPTEVVALGSLLFERGDGAGAMDLFVDGVFVEQISWAAGAGSTEFEADFTSSVAARTGTTFDFVSVLDEFRIQRLTVSTVSEPTSLALAALLVACGLRARKRS